MRNKNYWFLPIVLMTLSATAFTPPLKKFAVPTDVTNVINNWVLTGSGGCHVSAYRFTAQGSSGATGYRWEYYNGTGWTQWGGSGSTASIWGGDGSCDLVDVRVTPYNSDGDGNTYTFLSERCPPFDNPDCLGLKNKKSQIVSKH